MDMISKIKDTLSEIEKQENITILLAIESGSRAWGFASPDSDYDVRFIYVRPMEDYLRLNEPRDIIEWQLDDVLDINGWDLKKALIQFRRGNATLFEWSNSPVIYKRTDAWDKIYDVAKSYFSAKQVYTTIMLPQKIHTKAICRTILSDTKSIFMHCGRFLPANISKNTIARHRYYLMSF